MTSNEKREHILAELERIYTGTETALDYNTPFQLLISTLLAAQSTDVQVNKVMEPFYKKHPDAASIAGLSLEYIEDQIKNIGLYRNKAKNMLATSQMIMSDYGGKVPETQEELVKLPGVGRKTANVVRSIAFGADAIAVDTHVFRVSNRLGLANAKDVVKTEEQLMKVIPREKWSSAHHWLIWHGRKVCRAQKPLCDICTLKDWCKEFSRYGEEFMYWKGK
ncbi:MAG: endonuclease III [Calditrichaeota bacterium]|nr:endonuclease III [Calditrichota bacterium]